MTAMLGGFEKSAHGGRRGNRPRGLKPTGSHVLHAALEGPLFHGGLHVGDLSKQ